MEIKRIRNICKSHKPLLALLGLVLLLAACGSATDSVGTASLDETADPAAVADDILIDEESVDPQDGNAPDEEPPLPADGETTVIDEGAPVTVDIDALTSGTWNLMFGGGPDGQITLVDGFPITMTFDGDGSFGGTAACNGYGGGYGVEGTQFFLGELGWQEMGCEPDVQAAEQLFFAALLDVDGINLSGSELALSGPSTELIFFQVDGLDIEELWGRSFALEATLAGGVASSVQGEEVFLAIHPDNTLEATTGCRTFAGSFTVFGSEVIMTESSATGDCAAELADQSNHIISVLGDGFTVEFDGDQLLISSMGNQGLQYRDITSDAVVDAPDEVEAEPAPNPPSEDG